MKRVHLLGMGLILGAVGLIGCNRQSGSPAPDNKDKKHAAHGKGPNGGVVFDLGALHAEFTVDHDKKQCMVLILGEDEKTPTPVDTKEFIVKTKEAKTKEGKVVPPLTIKLLPVEEKDGKATKFVGTDPGLGNIADFEGTVVGEIDRKGAQGNFKEE